MHMDTIKGHYTPIPFKIIKHISGKSLKLKDLVTYFFSTSNDSEFAVSIRTLSDETGLSRVYIRESLERLKTFGYLTWTISHRRERVKIKDRYHWINVERRCFSRSLSFREKSVQHRKVQNAWKNLICKPEDLTNIFGYQPESGIGATELAMLIFLRTLRFESDRAEAVEENVVLNVSDLSSTLGVSRATVRNSLKVLADLRMVRIDPDTQVIQIKDSRINYITDKRIEAKAKERRVEKRRNSDQFSFVDQMILRKAIEEAGSKKYLASVRGYLCDLAGSGFIDEHRLASFIQLCEVSETRLKAHPEECDYEAVFRGETIFPVWIGGSNG
jgi:DNA-binding FadR family transcriptional regulator